ncbi:MAG: hypothetical protein Q9M94_01105 [Candidatus Gracilibacteria bacterium]|nr:hypothetical protein [Candidatus Gracilibacteria bacterium]
MNSDVFQGDVDIVLNNFNKVLKLLIFCYEKIISEITFNLDEFENFIRNIFITNLRNNKKLFGLGKIYFEAELEEIKDNYTTGGFIDIKVGNIEGGDFCDENKYFAFECKRINGYSEHKKEYVDNGLSRFISGQYSKSMQLSGMIGFVQGFKKGKNIGDNIQKIKDFLKNESKIKIKSNTIQNLEYYEIEKSFNYSYFSKHKRERKLGNIDIYHLFFDFTQGTQ